MEKKMADNVGIVAERKNPITIIKESVELVATDPFFEMRINQWKNIFRILRSGRFNIGSGAVNEKLFYNLSKKWRNLYYDSEAWQLKRDKILFDADYVCQSSTCDDRAWQVHHLNYHRLGDEDDSDLLALCGICHQDHHPERYIPQW